MTRLPHPRTAADEPVPATAGHPAHEVAFALSNIERLRSIGAYDLSNPELRARLDELTAITRERSGLDVALVTVVLDSVQLVLGSSGLTGWIKDAGGTPVEWAFCSHVVAAGRPYIVPDAASDATQRDNPLVSLDSVASYAGVPLVSPSGQVLGAHCVIGTEPHEFTVGELEELERGAGAVLALLEEYRIVTADEALAEG